MLLDYFLENPPILAMNLLVLLLILAIPIRIWSNRKEASPPAPSSTKFMGTRFDLTLLIFGLLFLAAIAIDLINKFIKTGGERGIRTLGKAINPTLP